MPANDPIQGVAIARFTPDGPLEVALTWDDAENPARNPYGVLAFTVPADPAAGVWSRRQLSDVSVGEQLTASDVDGDELTIIVTVEPLHGSLECVGEVCTYTPMPGWYGEDSLSFKANDGTLDSNEAVVTFRVAALPRIYLPIAFK